MSPEALLLQSPAATATLSVPLNIIRIICVSLSLRSPPYSQVTARNEQASGTISKKNGHRPSLIPVHDEALRKEGRRIGCVSDKENEFSCPELGQQLRAVLAPSPETRQARWQWHLPKNAAKALCPLCRRHHRRHRRSRFRTEQRRPAPASKCPAVVDWRFES